MKTKFLKIGIPIMVFMLAIVFAFATEKTTAKNESLITGYIFKDGKCEPTSKDCNNIGSNVCVTSIDGNNYNIYRLSVNNGTMCVEELYHQDWP